MTTPTEAAMEWLESRGLDREVCARMGLGGATAQDGGVLVRIPYVRDGQVITKQYRRIDRKEYRFAPGGQIDLWNVDVLKDHTLSNQPIMIAEGVFDALSLMQAGYQRVVAVPGWSDRNYTPDNYEPFKRNEALLRQAPRVIVTQDHDATGDAMVKAIANFLEDTEVCYVRWPDGCKDANDVLREWGTDYIVAVINSAKQMDPPGLTVSGFSDHAPEPPRLVWNLGDGYKHINQRICFRSREISIITGSPGSGKTTFITWLAHHLVRVHDVRIGLAMFETDYRELLHHLLVLQGHAAPELDGRLNGDESDAVRDAVRKLDRNFRILRKVDTDQHLHGMEWLRKAIKVAAARDGCKIIVIDPWNELDHAPEENESLTNCIGVSLNRIRQWAERYDIHVCIVVHPRKMSDVKRVAGGWDIADSAHFFNKAGIGVTVYRDEDDGFVTLRTWKVRNEQETGCRRGKTYLTFDPHSMAYRPRQRPAANQGEQDGLAGNLDEAKT